jgi:hypothetical protein
MGLLTNETDPGAMAGRDYEAPVLVPLGNLHDLLAAGGSNNCDGTDQAPGSGTDPGSMCGL